MADLPGQIASPLSAHGVRIGKVVTTSPLTINVAGGIFEAGRLASYTTINVGDIVAVSRQENSWLVLGEVLAP
jgi:hypothetical protein